MSQDIHVLCAMKINGTTIDQIKEQSIDPRIREALVDADGAVDPTYAAIMECDPVMSFQTTDLPGFLALCGISGLAISANVVLYYQKCSEDGIRVSGANHKTVTIAAGMVIPRSISARQGGEAVLSFDVIARSTDGLASPIALASGVALPTGLAVDVLFTAGPWKLNGSMQEGLQSIDFDFGLSEKLRRHSGMVYPYHICIESRHPKVRIKTTDVAFFTGNDVDGVAQGATASLVWFRKMAREGTRTANATAEHVQLTIYDGIWKPGRTGGGHPGEQTVDVEIMPISDGTNPIVGISAAAAIA